MEGRTTFVVAHRFSTLRGVDRIVVLDQGALVGSGTHDELVEQCGVIGACGRVRAHHRSVPVRAGKPPGGRPMLISGPLGLSGCDPRAGGSKRVPRKNIAARRQTRTGLHHRGGTGERPLRAHGREH